MSKISFENVGFLYKFWFCIFDHIESMLPFSFLKRYFFDKKKWFSDLWVLLNLILSFIAMMLVHKNWLPQLMGLIKVYALVRVFEIVIYQMNVLLFHPYKAWKDKKARYSVQSPHRSVVLLIHNLFEVIFWFTAVTMCFDPVTGISANEPLPFKVIDHTIRIFTFSYDNVGDQGYFLQMVFFFEVICGLILTVVSVAKFVGDLPHTNMQFAQQCGQASEAEAREDL